MLVSRIGKKERHKRLQEKLHISPFQTDEELAEEFGVSVATIRLDRLSLGIPELRVRIRHCAQEHLPTAHPQVMGELVDCTIGEAALSIMSATEEMVDSMKVVCSSFLYNQANSLAKAVVGVPCLTAVGNVKYKQPVTIGDRLIAKAEVIRQKDNKYYVWVTTRKKEKEVFRAKFIMESFG